MSIQYSKKRFAALAAAIFLSSAFAPFGSDVHFADAVGVCVAQENDSQTSEPDYRADYAAFAERFVAPEFPQVASADEQKGWFANKKTRGRDLIKFAFAKYPAFDVPPSDAAPGAWEAFTAKAALLRARVGELIFDENHGGTLVKKYYTTDFEAEKIIALRQGATDAKNELLTALNDLSQDSVWKAERRAELDRWDADFDGWLKPFCRASIEKLPSIEEFANEPDNYLVAATLLEFAVNYIPQDEKLGALVDDISRSLDAPDSVKIRVFHGRYEGMEPVSRETIFARYRARIAAVQDARVNGKLNPNLLESNVFNDRQTNLFEHGSLPKWGAQDPAQTDRFYVVFPKDGPADNRPLYVVLHSAGHSAKTALDCTLTVGNHDIYRAPDDFFAIYVDCFDNKATDWWWGGRRADEAEITPENAARATAEFQPVEKRVLDEIDWTIKTYKIDPNRVYLCGNSMGGSGTLGLGLRNGDVFAAIKANVPAGVWHAFDRLQLSQPEVPQGLPEPPVCLDYSAPNDDWSQGHEALFAGMEARKYSYIAYWGNYGHENNDVKVAKHNDLFKTFDWLSIRKNESYPVFTNASTDDSIPWPERPTDAPAGQRGAYFRWANRVDSADRYAIELRLASAEELNSQLFTAPTEATADVTLRRLQNFEIGPGATVNWTLGDKSGVATADARGVVTIPNLTIQTTPVELSLTK